mmetsp:Transcript_15015/g.48943  ORF Transcript_15015/g.48943 Transcript_15015/m.48943 type:complete len:271 (+) Transcript_15015:2306-3118(+)
MAVCSGRATSSGQRPRGHGKRGGLLHVPHGCAGRSHQHELHRPRQLREAPQPASRVARVAAAAVDPAGGGGSRLGGGCDAHDRRRQRRGGRRRGVPSQRAVLPYPRGRGADRPGSAAARRRRRLRLWPQLPCAVLASVRCPVGPRHGRRQRGGARCRGRCRRPTDSAHGREEGPARWLAASGHRPHSEQQRRADRRLAGQGGPLATGAVAARRVAWHVLHGWDLPLRAAPARRPPQPRPTAHAAARAGWAAAGRGRGLLHQLRRLHAGAC